MINNHGRTLSLPVPSSFSSSTEFLQQCVTMTAAGNNSTFGEVGGSEWEILTNLLQRQRDVVVIKPQQEEHLQNRLLLMQLPQSEQGGGGYFNNFHMLAAATDSIEPSSSLARQTEQGGGEFVVSNGDDSDLNRILTRPVKGEWPELARFVAGVMTSADSSNETTSAVNFPTTVSCPAPPGVAGITPITVFNPKETYPPLTVTADMGMDGLSIGKLRGVRRRECFKKRKTEDKALISPPRMKSEEEEEEEAEDGDEAKKRAKGGCCVQVQQVKKNTDDQQLCKNGNSNGSSSPNNETNRDNKILPGEEVSGCTVSKENNNINSRVEVQNQKPDYIHVRARRGQATDSHSLAERVRREKISERMKYLQDLVPGCNKIIGKAGMLDEIINYVQSLQRQVEFLSMKLATVNPTLDFNIEDFFTKQVLYSSNYQTMPIPSEVGNNPGLNILYNPTTQNQTGVVSGFEMVMNEESDHMGLLRRTISAPVSLPAAAAAAAADTHQHLDLSYLTQEDICRLSWDNGADLLQSIYSTMEEFHPERVHQQQQPFSEADYLKMEIQ